MENDQLEIVHVDVNVIKCAPFNPDSRVNVKSLEQLEHEIKKVGKILVPLALTRTGKLADGHRRLAIAKRLGWKTVPCIYYDTDNAKQLWATLNSGTKPVSSKTWVEAYSKGLDLDYFPPRQKSQMIGLQRILSEEEFELFVSKKRSPGILQTAYQVANFCHDSSDAFVREIVMWVMQYEQMSLLRNAIRDGMESDKVVEIILEKRKMKRGWV